MKNKKANCLVCDKEFEYDPRYHKGLYCSRDCRYIAHSDIIKKSYNNKLKEKRSKDALKDWTENPNRLLIKKNATIRAFFEKVMTDKKLGRPSTFSKKQCICKHCGATFYDKLIDRNGDFCCNQCSIDYSRLNSTNYRIKAFEHFEPLCDLCDEDNKKKLVVHHRDFNRFNNDLENLQILCYRCHAVEHKSFNSRNKQFKDKQIMQGWRMIIDGLRLNTNDPNFKHTPHRILKSYYEMFDGLNSKEKIDEILSTSFPTDYNGMIIESPIRCYSMCPHHFLPVTYDVAIGYVPSKGGLGLSKLPRLVELLSQAPKLQEDFTREIVDFLHNTLKPQGVMVVVKGEHLCMQMRGIKKPGCATTTSAFKGVFEEIGARQEFMSLIKKDFIL